MNTPTPATESEWRIEVDFMGRPHLANHELSMHWAKKARIHREWRKAGSQAAMVARLPRDMPPCRVIATARFRRGTLPDAAAIAPSVKCLVDGLVDYGCWPDDSSAWVVEESYRPAVRDRDRPDAVVLRLVPRLKPRDRGWT